MGTLIVYCRNRPKDEIVEVGAIPVKQEDGSVVRFGNGGAGLGWFLNGHVYENLEGFEGTVHVGTPMPDGRLPKLPKVRGWDGRDELVKKVLAEATAEPKPQPNVKPAPTSSAPADTDEKKEASE